MLVNSIGDKTASLKKLSYVAAAWQITRKREVREPYWADAGRAV